MAAGPDARAVDTAASTVDGDAFDHDVEILFPVVDLIVAEQDLGETRSVRLNFRIAPIAIHGCSTAEDEASVATVEDRRAHIAFPGVDGNRLAWNARLEERSGHAIRRPGFLRAWLQHQANLHRDDRQPQRVNAGGV